MAKDNIHQTKHDLKKSIRRLKLMFDYIESHQEEMDDEDFQKIADDFEKDLNIVTKNWNTFLKEVKRQ